MHPGNPPFFEHYPDFTHEYLPGALYFSKQWIESFLRNCNEDDLAISGISWFSGDRTYLNPRGSFKIWPNAPGATWMEFKTWSNSRAAEELNALPPDTGLVSFEFATPSTWWHMQQEGRKWSGRLDGVHQVAHLQGKQIVLEARLNAETVKANSLSPGCMVFITISLVLKAIFLFGYFMDSCTSTGY